MPRCTFILSTRNQCRRESVDGQIYCGICNNKIIERETLAGPVRPGICCRIKTSGQRCDRAVQDATSTICRTHRQIDERRERERREENEFHEQLEERLGAIRTNQATVHWYIALQMVHLEYRGGIIGRRLWLRISETIPHLYRNAELITNFLRFHNTLITSPILPIEMEENQRDAFLQQHLYQQPLAAIGELGTLAADRQNVHTRHVSKQTNEGLDRLLKIEIPAEQHTKKAIAKAWITIYALKDVYWKTYLDILNDMHTWYETESCRETGDKLYKRVLDGAWALIQHSKGEIKLQLIKRLYEEARDSYQMCSEGHITRIVNVFSGFDDSFKGNQSIGEKIQEAMSEISLQDITHEAKVALAKNLFITLGISEEERAPWIDAL